MYSKYLYEAADYQFETTDQDIDKSYLKFNKELNTKLSNCIKDNFGNILSNTFQSKYDDINVIIKLEDNGNYKAYSNSIDNIDKFIIYLDTLSQNE